MRSSFSSAGIQQFFAHVPKDVHRPLHTNLARQDGVLILNAEYAVVAHLHVGAHHILPQVGAMPVAHSAEDGGRAGYFLRLKGKIKHAVLLDVLFEQHRVFHVSVVNGSLFAQEADHLHRVTFLPEEVAEVAVGADFLTHRFPQPHESLGIVDAETGVHLESQFVHAMLAGKFGGFLPVGNDLFFPLPVENLGVLGRPAVSRPVGHGVRGAAAGASGKSHDYRDLQALSQQHRVAEYLRVAGSDFCVRMDRIAVAAERRYADVSVLELLFPGARLGWISQQLLHRTMAVARVTAGANLYRLQLQGADLLQHLVEAQIVVNRIENANQQLARRIGG